MRQYGVPCPSASKFDPPFPLPFPVPFSRQSTAGGWVMAGRGRQELLDLAATVRFRQFDPAASVAGRKGQSSVHRVVEFRDSLQPKPTRACCRYLTPALKRVSQRVSGRIVTGARPEELRCGLSGHRGSEVRFETSCMPAFRPSIAIVFRAGADQHGNIIGRWSRMSVRRRPVRSTGTVRTRSRGQPIAKCGTGPTNAPGAARRRR